MTSTNWKQEQKVSNKYYHRIKWLESKIKNLVATYSEPSEIIAGILKLTTSPEWQSIAANEAHKMVKELSLTNAKNWREAAHKSRKGYMISKTLTNEFTNNIAFN